jgi:hypothetical protein
MMAHLFGRKEAVSDRLLNRNLNPVPSQGPAAPGDGHPAILLSPGREELFSYYYFTYASALGRWQAPGRFGEESGE